MSGDAAAEQVRKESGGASWRPLLSMSLFAPILQPCSLEEGDQGARSTEKWWEWGARADWDLQLSFGFSVLGISMSTFGLDSNGEAASTSLGPWDNLGWMPAFHTISIGIDCWNMYSLISKNLAVFPRPFSDIYIYTVPRNRLIAWEIMWG